MRVQGGLGSEDHAEGRGLSGGGILLGRLNKFLKLEVERLLLHGDWDCEVVDHTVEYGAEGKSANDYAYCYRQSKIMNQKS